MKLVIIGTDHRLQHSVFQDANTKKWVPRRGGHRYRRLIAYCIEKLGVKAILEEAHAEQERTAPTIASRIAKERGLDWQALGMGEPKLSDFLFDPPFMQAIYSGAKPDALAGIYDLEVHAVRENFMYETITRFMQEHDCVLAIVGYIHLGVIARMVETERISVEAFMFTYPLVVDEARS